jgi:D-alanyl-D-alanine carboxypeptidase
MATLALAMMSHYPEDYKMFRLTSFTWRGQTYRNHNNLLGRYNGTEGIKTGYIRASGYNLVATVRRGDKLAVGIVMGGKSGSSRDAHMRAILDESFPKLSTRQTLPAPTKPELVAAAPEPPTAAAPARTAGARDGVIRLTMVSIPPRSRELPLAEPVSRDVVYHSAAAGTLAPSPIRPTAARSAVMRAAPWPPTAMSAYQISATPEATASYAEPGAAGDAEDPIEQLIAAAMVAPPVTASMGNVRVGRLIVPEHVGETPLEVAAEDSGEAALAATANFTPAPEAIDIPAGYQIQVGAYASQNDAQRRIERVQESADSLLAKAMSFTPTVETDSGTFYRARFAGLDKQAANRACSALKKKRIDCIVVAQ